MQKQIKKIAAGILAAAMIVPTTVSITEPLSASAYEILGETSFSHKCIPWCPVESSYAKQNFNFDDGAAHLVIIQPYGEYHEQWELQFRHRNLSFKKGHQYKVSFTAKAKRNGMEICSHIGNLTGDERYFVLDGKSNDMHMGPSMEGQWGTPVKLTTEFKEYSGVFTPTADIEGAEWAFWYADDALGYGGNAIKGDEIWFDNMSIDDLTEDGNPPSWNVLYTSRQYSGLENNYISVNQLGYFTGLEKIATLGDNKGDFADGAPTISLEESYDYEIVRVSDDTVAYSGKTASPAKDRDSGDNVCKIDFTGFDEAGEYYIRIKGKEWRSFPFRIGEGIYSDSEHNLLTNTLNYFYQNRSGVDINEKFITSGDKRSLAHADGYGDVVGYVQTEWNNSYMSKPEDAIKNSSSEISTKGGWYTAYNHDKYMTESGIALWTLQNLYERSTFFNDSLKKFADASGTDIVPESGNAYPDILDECRYELDYMSKMKVQPDEKTWGEYAGMYYHSIRGVGFVPNPKAYGSDKRYAYAVDPPTFAATLNYAACAAQGARLWQPYDSEYAEQLLTSAKEAYDAYKKNWYEASPNEESEPHSLYAPLYHGKTNVFYGDAEVRDDAYWAACELFITAKTMNDDSADTYFKDLSGYKNAFKISPRITGGYSSISGNSLTLFNKDNTAAAGSISLLLNHHLIPSDENSTLMDSFVKVADEYIDAEQKQGYSLPYQYDGPGYCYESYSYYDIVLKGFEKDSNERIINNMVAMAYAYEITGENKYLNGIVTGMNYLLGNNPMSYSFITGYGDYHVKNPSHRYWQYELDKTMPAAPDGVIVNGPNTMTPNLYMRLLGLDYALIDDLSERMYCDSIESWSNNEASLSANASLAWIVSFLQDVAPSESAVTDVMGDVDNDGKFAISDVVTFQKWLLGNKNYKLANWKAADFCKDNRLDIFDLSVMRKELINKIDTSYVKPEIELDFGPRFNVWADKLELYLAPDESSSSVATIPSRTNLIEYGFQKDDDKWLFTKYNGQYGWVKIVDDEGKPTVYYDAVAAKPVIYLYPQQETDVHVDLELTESELSTTYPKYNNGWDVTAYPDGTLLNKSDGTHHRYLFWDSNNCRTRFDFSKGFCVAGDDTESFLREKLKYMGLTEDEMNEFIVYWLPKMEHNAYNLIAFQGDVYTESAKLNITPKPDSLCRIFMAYVPLENAMDIEPQQLETFERKGFTVVEWGGSEIKS